MKSLLQELKDEVEESKKIREMGLYKYLEQISK